MISFVYFAILMVPCVKSLAARESKVTTPVRYLQTPHPFRTPEESLHHLAVSCEELGIDQIWDVYGDFHKSKNESFLRRFEAEVAEEFQKEDAVFMPSGGMAQSIALLIHSKKQQQSEPYNHDSKSRFLCHATSHLILHEQDAFSELCGLDAIVLPPSDGTGLGAAPFLFEHVDDFIESDSSRGISTLLLELPHREIGGKLTPWESVLKMRDWTRQNKIAFHCDGARIFEATTGYEKSVAELVKPFDSVYISFYKGLGGLSGAMLLGTNEFCEEARVWLRRFGGNLYTLLPYCVSGWNGYRQNWSIPEKQSSSNRVRFADKKSKLVRLASAFSSSKVVSKVLTFEPQIPEVNMVHCYLKIPMELAERTRDKVEIELGISVFHRLRQIDEAEVAFKEGYFCRFELSIGEANGSIEDNLWLRAWERFATIVSTSI